MNASLHRNHIVYKNNETNRSQESIMKCNVSHGYNEDTKLMFEELGEASYAVRWYVVSRGDVNIYLVARTPRKNVICYYKRIE